MVQKGIIRRVLWACLNKWCFKHPKRNRTWSDDIYASSRSRGFQG